MNRRSFIPTVEVPRALAHENAPPYVEGILSGALKPRVAEDKPKFRPFTEQLDQLGVSASGEFNQEIAPEIIFFTTMSAIPMADVIRGIYDAAGVPNEHQARLLPINGPMCRYIGLGFKTERELDDDEETHLSELTRLASETEIGRVTVIDQFRGMGHTLKGARTALDEAGFPEISTLTGYWYVDASTEESPLDIDTVNMTSGLSDFMLSTGRVCYEQLLNTPQH